MAPTTLETPTHRATRPVTATSLREYAEAVIKAQASAREALYGREAGERFLARELRVLSQFTDAEILAGAHRSSEDVADRLVNGAASDGYDWVDDEGDTNGN
jgi:hypothetical protein